jgi:hypothetical protein
MIDIAVALFPIACLFVQRCIVRRTSVPVRRYKTTNSPGSPCITAWLGLRKRREYFQIAVWREVPGKQNNRLPD